VLCEKFARQRFDRFGRVFGRDVDVYCWRELGQHAGALREMPGLGPKAYLVLGGVKLLLPSRHARRLALKRQRVKSRLAQV